MTDQSFKLHFDWLLRNLYMRKDDNVEQSKIMFSNCIENILSNFCTKIATLTHSFVPEVMIRWLNNNDHNVLDFFDLYFFSRACEIWKILYIKS